MTSYIARYFVQNHQVLHSSVPTFALVYVNICNTLVLLLSIYGEKKLLSSQMPTSAK